MLAILRRSGIVTGSCCKAVVEKGNGERLRQNLSGRGGLSLQQDELKGLYMGRHVGRFFFFYCFEQERWFYS